MKVADLVADLEKGDRTMEHLVPKEPPQQTGNFLDPLNLGGGAGNLSDVWSNQILMNMLRNQQGQGLAQQFASSQSFGGFLNGSAGGIRW